MGVPYLDMKAQYATVQAELEEAVIDVLRSGTYALGPAVADFEKSYSDWCDTKHCIAVNSGTSALHIALLAAGVGPGDEVITPAMTFVATQSAVLYCGATPVLVDIDPVSWQIDPEQVERAISHKTKAILPVHLHGQMADMRALSSVAESSNLLLLEDSAQSHGATQFGRKAGTLGMMGCFSFYPGKNLGACGEGGAIVTDDAELANHMRQMRDWGQTQKYHHELPGFNYRMDAVQGAVLGVKLRKLQEWIDARRRVAARYEELLSGLPISLPVQSEGNSHVYHVYSILSDARDELQKFLGASGIGCSVHYPISVDQQTYFKNKVRVCGDLQNAHDIASRALSLPIFPEMQDCQIEEVAEVVHRFFKG